MSAIVMPPRVPIVLMLTALLAVGAGVVGLNPAGDLRSSLARPSATRAVEDAAEPPTVAEDSIRLDAPTRPIRIRGASLFGWALLDRISGALTGSANSNSVVNTVESMIKPWIAADYLRRLADGRRPSADVLDELATMIVDSNDPATEMYYQIGGGDAVVRRLIEICRLTGVAIEPTKWSWTRMTPQAAARYGACLADGRAAGSEWTPWILDAMKNVRGDVTDQTSGRVQGGRWGIIDGLPPELARDVSIKNGWTSYVDGWHVNCLAVHPDWSLAVMVRMPTLRSAAQACQDVARALVVNG
jgi:hypothetical protein